MALLNSKSSQAIQDSKFLFAQPLVDGQVGKLAEKPSALPMASAVD
jgi:hypothetical protein